MAQHDYVIDNASGATVRADINSALSAIQTQNSGTSAPSSTAAGMLWLDTSGGLPYALKIRDGGNNHWLTIASVTDPGSDGNIETSATIKGTIDSTASGTLGDNINFPAGHCIQMVTPSVVEETNTLTTTYTNLHEVSITLKGGNSKILILHEFNWFTNSGVGIGQKVFKKTSSGATTSDTLVFDKQTGDGTGPLLYYGGSTNLYFTAHHHFVDDASSHNAGDTIYYGFFYRVRSGTAAIPPNNTPDGYFKTTLLEISG